VEVHRILRVRVGFRSASTLLNECCRILPTALMPLRLLSVPSLLSTVSSFLLVAVILIDGLYKVKSPGSLRHPAETSLGPELQGGNWLGGVGLVLAGFGGHAVVPSLARDMRRPQNFAKVSFESSRIFNGKRR
jgi:vesicular inhibitory amino acid transporter